MQIRGAPCSYEYLIPCSSPETSVDFLLCKVFYTPVYHAPEWDSDLKCRKKCSFCLQITVNVENTSDRSTVAKKVYHILGALTAPAMRACCRQGKSSTFATSNYNGSRKTCKICKNKLFPLGNRFLNFYYKRLNYYGSRKTCKNMQEKALSVRVIDSLTSTINRQ